MSVTTTKTETILERLRVHAKEKQNETAYTFLHNDQHRSSCTFGELDLQAERIARGLLQKARPGDRALMMYPSGLGFIQAFLGCMYAGIIPVPAYPPRKNRNANRVEAIIRDCNPELFLCTSELRTDIATTLHQHTDSANLIPTDCLDIEEEFPLPYLQESGPAFLQYTSGSTSEPRGVIVTHGNLVANEKLIQKYFAFDEASVMVSWLPMFHDMGLIGGVLAPLYGGFHSVLMAPSTFLWRPFRWLQAVSDFAATCTGAPNFAYERCVRGIKPHEKENLDLSSLRVAYNGSEPVRAETLRRFGHAFKECGLREDVAMPCYGMAETTLLVSGGPPLKPRKVIHASQKDLERHKVVESASGHEIVSCGQIGPDLKVKVVEPTHKRSIGPHEIGEIWVAGESVSPGYWQNPESTDQAFNCSLEGSEAEWYRTGDYGFVRDNELFVTGRLKDLIIIRGRNIYPQDIEKQIQSNFRLDTENSVAAFTVDVEGNETIAVVIEASKSIYRLARLNQRVARSKVEDQLVEFRDMVRRSREAIASGFEATLSHICVVKPGSFHRTSSGKVMRSRTACEFFDRTLVTLNLPFTCHW